MNKITSLIQKAFNICQETLDAIQIQKIKPSTKKEQLKQEVISLVFDTKDIFIQATDLADDADQLTKVYEGLRKLYEVDNKLQQMKNKYSPVREIYPELVKFSVIDSVQEKIKDFHGILIPIPFPTPEEFVAFLRHMFTKE